VKVFAEKLIPVKELTASVVRCGKGGRLSLQALAESEFYAPLAAADLRPEVGDELRKKFPGLRIFADFREMFAGTSDE
jgi:hypothetical protein